MKLFEIADEQAAKRKFEQIIRKRTTKFCHESPAPWRSFLKRGIDDESVYCTVNQKSNFISTPNKTLIWFKVPNYVHVIPDMRYDGSYVELLKEHPEVTGADVSVESNVPVKWIVEIIEVTDKGSMTQWVPDDEDF